MRQFSAVVGRKEQKGALSATALAVILPPGGPRYTAATQVAHQAPWFSVFFKEVSGPLAYVPQARNAAPTPGLRARSPAAGRRAVAQRIPPELERTILSVRRRLQPHATPATRYSLIGATSS